MALLLKRFLAGVASTLVVHQAIVAVYHAMGRYPRPAWDLSPTAPLGVPAIVSLSFWGGVWAIALFALAGRMSTRRRAPAFVLAGGILPTLVALLVVYPMKGLAVAQQGAAIAFAGGFVANAAWAMGTLAFASLAGALKPPPSP